MKLRGWLFDLYPAKQGGITLWVIGEDGKRRQFWQAFPLTFYAAGPRQRLRDLWRYLFTLEKPPVLSRVERRDLFQPNPIPVMGITINRQEDLDDLFSKAQATFPDLDYYDADISPSLRYAARYQTFPLAYCDLEIEGQQVESITPLETPWQLDTDLPPLRILRLEPDADPSHCQPHKLKIQYGSASYALPFDSPRPLLIDLSAILNQYDPDLILTRWGDTWLFPRLSELSKEWNLPIPFNRDPSQDITIIAERSYFSYGQIVYRGQQMHLFGRWHIDSNNALLYQDFELEGIYETARVTRLPIQVSARVSPGTGISSMQIITALQHGILVPWRKQQGEQFKTALDLIHRDQGGLVYQPIVGVHENVAELDFVSMYPGLMVKFNISPETAGQSAGNPENLTPFPNSPGLVPLTLAPLLEKRLALKARIKTLSKWDSRLKSDQARAIAHKWLLVTCFGYLGYKNARFGRIEAHEAVTAYGREALLRAKESVESLDCIALQLYVDGLWVKHAEWKEPKDFQPALEAIIENTCLPITLDGVYNWIAFLSSKQDQRVPVPNRYFGVFQDGTIKVRGIEARRRDTPAWAANAQMKLLEHLAKAESVEAVHGLIPEGVALLHNEWQNLQVGCVTPEDLLISQRLSRELSEYRARSPVARAVLQLSKAGKSIKPGQRIRYLFTRGDPGVYAWDLGNPPKPGALDCQRYLTLLVRAASTILQPFGVEQTELREWIVKGKEPIKQLILGFN
jgi:DNA polymerase-2